MDPNLIKSNNNNTVNFVPKTTHNSNIKRIPTGLKASLLTKVNKQHL
jgi:hypothetical protein